MSTTSKIHLVKHGEIAIVYDGDGNRVAKTVGAVTTNYLVDTNNRTGRAQVLEEIQGGQVAKQYAYGLNLISENQQLGASNCPSTATTVLFVLKKEPTSADRGRCGDDNRALVAVRHVSREIDATSGELR